MGLTIRIFIGFVNSIINSVVIILERIKDTFLTIKVRIVKESFFQNLFKKNLALPWVRPAVLCRAGSCPASPSTPLVCPTISHYIIKPLI